MLKFYRHYLLPKEFVVYTDRFDVWGLRGGVGRMVYVLTPLVSSQMATISMNMMQHTYLILNQSIRDYKLIKS